MATLSWGGIGLRFLFAAILVFATYNPYYSYYQWLLNHGKDSVPLTLFLGVVLLIGWSMYGRATMRSLHAFGLVLALLFFGLLVWLLFDLGLRTNNPTILTVTVELILVGVLGTGISWSHIRRRVTGQYDIDDDDND